MFARGGKAIFKNPMLLVANINIKSGEDAKMAYHIYLKRTKIESVFKFLKEALGWEDFQVRDYYTIKNLIAFCYFVAGYFYEIEKELAENESIKFLAYLGNGKGKITKYYVLRGMEKLVNKIVAENMIKEYKVDKSVLDQAIDLTGVI